MLAATSQEKLSAAPPSGLHRMIWRWHFYAGLFCVPFVTWLSITGCIYLFKPQIETWLDRPYDHLQGTLARASAEAQVRAAMAAVPGSFLHDYELPQRPDSAVRVIVGKASEEYRVYVHPGSLQILNIANEDKRPMRVLFWMHGELLSGEKGSMIVELAASWTITMLLTGLFLWFPRQSWSLAGTLYPRLRQGGRLFWRDLHSVTGLWVSCFALFLLFTGLPWAKNWGGYLRKVRTATGATQPVDWTIGSAEERRARVAKNPVAAGGGGEHAGHGRRRAQGAAMSYAPLDTMIATVAPLHLAYPVLITPPTTPDGIWKARSDAGNRTLRVNLDLDPKTGAILNRIDFAQRHWIDRATGVGIAAHEGQLFPLNQVLGVFTAVSLNILNISGVVMWWRRRPGGVLGAPVALYRARIPIFVFVPIVLLSIWLPLFGATLIAVFLIEHFVLRRISPASQWLGLASPA